jgi:hypothetical protein
MNRDQFKRIEQKYLFPGGQKDIILAWLEHACLPDPQYPVSLVSSLYYDTPGLFHYQESKNGDFLRAKVRLRWYGQEDNGSVVPSVTARCYLEIKNKQGALSEKQRREVTIPRHILFDDPFSNDQILSLPVRVFALDQRVSGLLVPMLIVEYRRQRYIDADSRVSIALDSEIRCTRVNEAFVYGIPPVYFDVGILEAKGMNPVSYGVLDPIGSYLTKSPFSKYAISLETLMHPLGRRV